MIGRKVDDDGDRTTTVIGRRRASGFDELAARQRGAFAHRWWFFAGIWLVFLIAPLVSLWEHDSISRRILGVALVAVFAFAYVVMIPRAFSARPEPRISALATMVGSAALYLIFCGDGSAFGPYLAVAFVLLLPWSVGVPLAVALGVVVMVVPQHVARWHEHGIQWDIGAGVLFAGVIMVAMRLFARTTDRLHRAEEEIEQLAAEQERLRIARDLHDLLGHALTTVTVKAELASRLVGRDPQRAAAEMAEVAELGRQSLSDVRDTVSGYREMSLVRELAAAREVLQAAGIEAEMPAAAEDVPGELRELFGWVVREGVTNAVLHSRARRVAVRLVGRAIEVENDGVDDRTGTDGVGTTGPRSAGHGLIGLSERAALLGGVLHAGPAGTDGYRLRVEVPALITVVLADDQHMVRGALAALLNLEDDIEVIGEVGRGDELVAAVETLAPDVALVDIEMPGLDGLAATAILSAVTPAVGILILTTFGRPGYLRRAMEAGALGFVVKDTPADQLADAVRRVARGERVVDPTLAAATLADGTSPLTGRERDVLMAARDGATVSDLAGRLFLSEGTVRNYLSSSIAKTGSRNRTEAVRIAEERGWL